MTNSQVNDLALAGQLVTAPASVFVELRERPRFLTPLILLCLGSVALVIWYYSAVDFEWLKDRMMSANSRLQNIPEADRARMFSSMTRNRILYPGAIGAGIGVAAVMALQALYFFLAGKITKVRYSYKHWFSLASWSNLPSILGVVAGAIVLAMQGSQLQMGPESLQVLSLNELLLHLSPTDRGYTLVSSINLLSVWCWVLAIIGVRTWSGRSWGFSSIFTLLPYAVIYACMALYAFS